MSRVSGARASPMKPWVVPSAAIFVACVSLAWPLSNSTAVINPVVSGISTKIDVRRALAPPSDAVSSFLRESALVQYNAVVSLALQVSQPPAAVEFTETRQDIKYSPLVSMQPALESGSADRMSGALAVVDRGTVVVSDHFSYQLVEKLRVLGEASVGSFALVPRDLSSEDADYDVYALSEPFTDPRTGLVRDRRREYNLRDQVGRGGQGEVWRAVRMNPDGTQDTSQTFVLKRMFMVRVSARSRYVCSCF